MKRNKCLGNYRYPKDLCIYLFVDSWVLACSPVLGSSLSPVACPIHTVQGNSTRYSREFLHHIIHFAAFEQLLIV